MWESKESSFTSFDVFLFFFKPLIQQISCQEISIVIFNSHKLCWVLSNVAGIS